MKFGPVPLDRAAEGTLLAHSLRAGGRRWSKGHRLTAADIRHLQDAGLTTVPVACPGETDVPENEAATLLGACLAGPGIRVGKSFAGRVNAHATAAGLVLVSPGGVLALNRTSETIALATRLPCERVGAGTMLATLKIIPLAVDRGLLEAGRQAVAPHMPLLALAPFPPRRAHLVITGIAGDFRLADRTIAVTTQRLAARNTTLAGCHRVAHEAPPIAALLDSLTLARQDIVIVFGASATPDRRDVIPAALVQAGGHILHHGMPVDPGNLLLSGILRDRPVIGAPGCARSPAPNGLDLVLDRICAGLAADSAAITAMGVGGLLKEASARPLAREHAWPPGPEGQAEAPAGETRHRITGLLLAAGSASRFGSQKLLAPLDGVPMVRRCATTLLAAGLAQVIVVTGADAGAVAGALDGLPVRIVHNPRHGTGLASSLRLAVGLLEQEGDCDGVVILHGDMPRVTPTHVREVVRRFAPEEGRAIVAAAAAGRQGHPVLFGACLFPGFHELEGDTGAAGLVRDHADRTCLVPFDDDGPVFDVDRPGDLARAWPPPDGEKG